MDVEIFTLCDFAKCYGGALSLSNPFDTILAPRVPHVHPFCVLAMRLRFTKSEEGTHSFAVHIIDQDGSNIAPRLSGELQVKVFPGRTTGAHDAAFTILSLSFPRYGEYSVRLTINKVEYRALPVFVISPPKAPAEKETETEDEEGESESNSSP